MKGGELIGGSDSRLVLTSSPLLDTGGIEVSIMSGDRILDAREEGRRVK